MEIKKIKRNAFLNGYRRIFDPYNNLRRTVHNENSHNLDRENINNDWKNIGMDIKKAINNYESSQTK